ncbi:MAG TPA: hypothetical protein VGN84_11585, partial [Solirubrobacterales bacterium]|nr:hypothetical protein [Solirubrobacterales bacterium]
TVGIQCPVNTKVEVTLVGCTVTVPPQAGLKSVTFKNINPKMGAKQEVTLEINVSGLTFELDPVGGTPTCKKEQRTNGTMTGSETETAELGGVMVGVWVE